MPWIVAVIIGILTVLGVLIYSNFTTFLLVNIIFLPISFIVLLFTKGPKKAWEIIWDYLKDWRNYL